ncbi:MAG: protein kinase, partial [Polyangiaceae bacterium]|nr:protein kinase [Polyangiaceae bacterium]
MFPRDPLPDRIGSYRILRRLASRRGADLYLGRHEGPMGFARECVLKLVPGPDVTQDPGSAQELAHEAKICARLNHPAIVRMHDFFEHGGHLVLVFEHFAGVSLSRVLSHYRRRRQRVPDSAVWYLAHRLFAALAHAHAMTNDAGRPTPVIHRDVQPAHLVMSSDGQVRLAGFGIAKIEGTEGTTAVGFVKGTPAYMAPEQARGEKVTERVDVYAAGLVVWEMLSGRSVRPPCDTAHGAALLKLIAGRRFDAITLVRRDIPREIGAAIDACLQVDPKKRGIACAEVERWLEKVVDVDAGRRELRERLVELRSATLRAIRSTTVSGRTASGIPRFMPPESASCSSQFPGAPPSRFPGLATRVTGRPSELADGDSPRRSSRRPPPLRSALSSRPARARDGGDDETADGGTIPASQRSAGVPGKEPSSQETPAILGLPATQPLLSVDWSEQLAPAQPPVDAAPDAAIESAPGPSASGVAFAEQATVTGETQAFVAGLRTPPGVQATPSQASAIAKPESMAPAAATERSGDTTLIARRRMIDRGLQLAVIGGAAAAALLVSLIVGGGVLARRSSQPVVAVGSAGGEPIARVPSATVASSLATAGPGSAATVTAVPSETALPARRAATTAEPVVTPVGAGASIPPAPSARRGIG